VKLTRIDLSKMRDLFDQAGVQPKKYTQCVLNVLADVHRGEFADIISNDDYANGVIDGWDDWNTLRTTSLEYRLGRADGSAARRILMP
jgi:hypothetical protein